MSARSSTFSFPPSSQPNPYLERISATPSTPTPDPSSTSLAACLFATSPKNIAIIKDNLQWTQIRKSYNVINKKGQPFLFFVLGSLVTNYLRDQGKFFQYALKMSVSKESSLALERILARCPEKGKTLPLVGNEFKLGVKYDRVFDTDERTKHNGAPTPYPYISDAREMDKGLIHPLDELPPIPADELGEGSSIAVAFTLANYTFREGGISAKLEHIYVLHLMKEEPLLESPAKRRKISLQDSDDE